VIQVCSIHDKQIYAMKIMSKSQIVKDNAVQQVKGKFLKKKWNYSKRFLEEKILFYIYLRNILSKIDFLCIYVDSR